MAKKKAPKKVPATKEPKLVHPVRLDLKPEDYQLLEEVSKELGLTKSAFLRMMLFKYFRETGRK